MPVLCRPAVAVPEHVISMEETLELARRLHPDHPRLDLVLRLIAHTDVRKRHLVQPITQTLTHPGLDVRNAIYAREARRRVPSVARSALASAGIEAPQVDAVIFVSCTGFLMPSMIAWMINNMGFRNDIRQIPIAQLGCAAGGAAINRASDFCVAYPDANVLIVACEFCSLCYQPTDDGIGSLLANGLFGDAVAAAVVRGHGGHGVRLERNSSYLVPDTEEWISYAVRPTGFHFQLDKRVPTTMAMLAPALRVLARQHGWDASDLDFYIIHAGGPRILDDLRDILGVDPSFFRHSRATLADHGNIASAVVLDSLRRMFDDDSLEHGARGMIAGFGPGITAETCVGSWVRDRAPAEVVTTHPLSPVPARLAPAPSRPSPVRSRPSPVTRSRPPAAQT
ncbi:1,3,6,8-tetrahydroxynaphthalene synthase [Frankia canadensis]|uniref:1,3,6,8-tetrahydroxynaphthalene synthase n=1 Tax=Frankia canadensis TaxID=1836972 RepID=A0A2I2KYF2_9ACTN|nr:type III polyketide synthase [Frankia canadensis]SNQ50688.1 1,3,6,8-tetrahydroxynaphthalene synthase [Frankia canadensis]SOU57978.1 1,3,6,8-tetrahydroxynaphthalene synthase [Frankia canadensis]